MSEEYGIHDFLGGGTRINLRTEFIGSVHRNNFRR